MTTYDLSQAPTSAQIGLRHNAAVYEHSLSAVAGVLDRGGLNWHMQVEFANRTGDERAELMALFAKLRGPVNMLRVPVIGNPKAGAYGGTPLVAGASQTGNSINVDGCTASITDWIKAGDYFSVTVNGEVELKMCTADASSNGSGAITISFEPRLRASPADNAAIHVDDGTLTPPAGVFICASDEMKWDNRLHRDGIGLSNFSLDLVEAIYATQA